MEGDESWVSDAPIINPPTDTDREEGEESKELIGSEEGADRWMSSGNEAERKVHTN